MKSLLDCSFWFFCSAKSDVPGTTQHDRRFQLTSYCQRTRTIAERIIELGERNKTGSWIVIINELNEFIDKSNSVRVMTLSILTRHVLHFNESLREFHDSYKLGLLGIFGYLAHPPTGPTHERLSRAQFREISACGILQHVPEPTKLSQ